MERVSSVTAFLARYLGDPDPQAQDVLNTLTPVELRVVKLLVRVVDPDERVRRLSHETNEAWSPARYRRAVELALNRLARVLHERQLLTA